MNTRVSRVLRVSPPITVIAKAAPMTETYSAVPIASGTIAIIVVEAVMRIGLILATPALISARDLLYPRWPEDLGVIDKYDPIVDYYPRSIRKPVRFQVKEGIARQYQAISEPRPARGMLSNKTKGIVRDSKTAARIM